MMTLSDDDVVGGGRLAAVWLDDLVPYTSYAN